MNRKPSILVVFLTVFIDLIGFGIVVPLVPLFSRHYGASGFVIGVIIASFSAMQFLFSPLWGKLSDRHGRRPPAPRRRYRLGRVPSTRPA